MEKTVAVPRPDSCGFCLFGMIFSLAENKDEAIAGAKEFKVLSDEVKLIQNTLTGDDELSHNKKDVNTRLNQMLKMNKFTDYIFNRLEYVFQNIK